MGGDVGDLFQGLGIEYLDAARLVVGDGDQLAVLADCTADAVAALDDAPLDARGQQVDFAQATIATEHVGVALVAGEHHRGVGQVAQAFDAAQGGAGVAFNDLQAAGGALYHHAQIAGAAQRCLGATAEQQGDGGGGEQ